MRKIVKCVLIVCLLVGLQNICFGELGNAEDYMTWSDVIWKKAKEDMLQCYGKDNYYEQTNKKGEALHMYSKWLVEEKETQSFYLAYGKAMPGTYSEDLNLYRYLGENYEGTDKLFNPPYGWEFWWNGRRLQNWGQVKIPWDAGLCEQGEYDNSDLASGSDTKDLEECIQRGLNMTYAGVPYSKVHASRSENNKNSVYDKDAKPTQGGEWRQYVHVTILPTSYTWGQGYMYDRYGNEMPVPIAPFQLVQPDFKPTITSPFQGPGAYNTDKVTADVTVASTFEKDQKTSYEWLIKGEKSGQVYAASACTGYGKTQTGEATIHGRHEAHKSTFSVEFVMPDESVRVIFIINPKNQPADPQENNKVEVLIPGLHYEIQDITYILNYDELSKDIEHSLGGGGISGSLEDPKEENSYYVDEEHMTGSLPVDMDTSVGGRTALENAQIKTNTNEPVDEPSTSASRSPVIQGTIDRPDFKDDPLNHSYHINGHVDNQMKAYYNKGRDYNLSRTYRYHIDHDVPTGTDADGHTTYTTCHWCTEYYSTGTTQGKFQPGEDHITIRALIYNGRKEMPHVDARDFKKEIENNTSDEVSKTIYWESEKFPMTVQRWMKRVELVEKPKQPKPEPVGDEERGGESEEPEVAEMEPKESWEPVDGQYKRIFSHQNKAEVTWAIANSLEQSYHNDRENARHSRRDKASYEKVPFATDKELQGYEYPFKSGYYFNPAGQYTVTVHTEIYKDKQEETEEHKALVDKLIESFRYSSNMQYVDKDGDIGKLELQIEDVEGKDTAYSEDHTLEAERDYQYVKDFEIPSWPDETGYTHDYFKEILEGFDESNTGDSKDEYNYREYIKEDKIFRIIEETTVTFNINPDNEIKKYTYGGMKDGTYHNTVWTADTDLSEVTRVPGMKLIGVNGETPLDQIPVTVKGSMYDDLNN